MLAIVVCVDVTSFISQTYLTGDQRKGSEGFYIRPYPHRVSSPPMLADAFHQYRSDLYKSLTDRSSPHVVVADVPDSVTEPIVEKLLARVRDVDLRPIAPSVERSASKDHSECERPVTPSGLRVCVGVDPRHNWENASEETTPLAVRSGRGRVEEEQWTSLIDLDERLIPRSVTPFSKSSLRDGKDGSNEKKSQKSKASWNRDVHWKKSPVEERLSHSQDVWNKFGKVADAGMRQYRKFHCYRTGKVSQRWFESARHTDRQLRQMKEQGDRSVEGQFSNALAASSSSLWSPRSATLRSSSSSSVSSMLATPRSPVSPFFASPQLDRNDDGEEEEDEKSIRLVEGIRNCSQSPIGRVRLTAVLLFVVCVCC